MKLLLIYLLSTAGGIIFVTLPVVLLHRAMGRIGNDTDQIGDRRPWYRLTDIVSGFAERAIATTLFIFAPNALPLFIGGWVAAKIAASWSHRQKQGYIAAHKVFLVGNALSFSLAICAGYLYRPASIEAFQPQSEQSAVADASNTVPESAIDR